MKDVLRGIFSYLNKVSLGRWIMNSNPVPLLPQRPAVTWTLRMRYVHNELTTSIQTRKHLLPTS